MKQTVLIIAAHPDDEVLGCGGTMAKLTAQGATVQVAFLADGISARVNDGKCDAEELTKRRQATFAACEILGTQPPTFHDFPDNQMDTIPLLRITKIIEAMIAQYQPDMLLTHHAGDINIDHRRVHEAVVIACRPQAMHPVKTLLFFEVPSSTEWQIPGSAPIFAPNWFEDISSAFNRKLEAIDAYAHEMRAWPHPRSREGVKALARWRGATIGVEAAEAFMLGRHLSCK